MRGSRNATACVPYKGQGLCSIRGFRNATAGVPYEENGMSDQELIDHLNNQDKERPVCKTHRLDIHRYASEEAKFFFTLCAQGNGRPFEDPSLAKAIIESLIWRKNKHNWTLFCYCLMPDHLHLVSGAPERQSTAYNAGMRARSRKVSCRRSPSSRAILHKSGGNMAVRGHFGRKAVTTICFATMNPCRRRHGIF